MDSTPKDALDAYLEAQHPNFHHWPDHGLPLDAQTDAQCRAKAESYGLDYDQLKRDFALSHQVIPEQPLTLAVYYADKNAVPLNFLKASFESFLHGMVLYQCRHQTAAPGSKSS